MRGTGLRIFCLLGLALAAGACGAASGSPTNPPDESLPPTWTLSAPTQEEALILEETPSPNPTAPGDSNPEPTTDSSGAEDTNPEPSTDSGSSQETQGSTSLTPTVFLTPDPSRPTSNKGPLCDDSKFVEDVTIPDGTVLRPGESFEKTWKLTNTGVCAWTTSYAIGYAYGALMHGTETKLTKSVAPGATVDITVKFTAPLPNCWYGSWWRLKNAKGVSFGDFVYASVIVSNGMENGTPYPTLCVG